MIKEDELLTICDTVDEINLSAQEDTSNEKLLLILNKESGLAPYSHEFCEGFQDPQILSGFISAISSFIGEVTGKNQGHWKTVFGSDSLILVESGEWSIGVLVASKETTEIRSKLRRIVREFEDCFEYLRDIEGIQNVFSDFDSYVRRMFVDERVTRRTVVTKNPEWRRYLSNFDLPSTAFDVTKILFGFEESTTVEQIEKAQNLQYERIIEIVSTAYWNNIVKLTYVPSDDDILNLSEKSTSILFRKSNPLGLSTSCLHTIARFDGRTPLSQFFKDEINSDKKSILNHLGFLVNRGLVQRISIENRLVLLDECMLSQLAEKGSAIIGSRKMKQYFETTKNETSHYHPRISRIILRDNMSVTCLLEDGMTPDDLDDMFDALEFFIKEIKKILSKKCGSSRTANLFEKIKNNCHRKWKPYLSEVVI